MAAIKNVCANCKVEFPGRFPVGMEDIGTLICWDCLQSYRNYFRIIESALARFDDGYVVETE